MSCVLFVNYKKYYFKTMRQLSSKEIYFGKLCVLILPLITKIVFLVLVCFRYSILLKSFTTSRNQQVLLDTTWKQAASIQLIFQTRLSQKYWFQLSTASRTLHSQSGFIGRNSAQTKQHLRKLHVNSHLNKIQKSLLCYCRRVVNSCKRLESVIKLALHYNMWFAPQIIHCFILYSNFCFLL